MWPHFEALAAVPVMVIRGAYSDILSAETVAAMKTRHPRLEVLEVPDQGHAPLLAEPDIIARIARFATKCDTARGSQGAENSNTIRPVHEPRRNSGSLLS